MRRAQCQNVLKRTKERQRPLCCACIKTRSQQSSLPHVSNYSMHWKILTNKTKASVNTDTCAMQDFLLAHLDLIVDLSN